MLFYKIEGLKSIALVSGVLELCRQLTDKYFYCFGCSLGIEMTLIVEATFTNVCLRNIVSLELFNEPRTP